MYTRLTIKEDTSRRSLQVRNFKRSALISFIYFYGEVVDDHVDVIVNSAFRVQKMIAALTRNDWVRIEPVVGGIKLYPGKVSTALPSLLKKMQFGRDKEISLKKVFKYIYAPNHMTILAFEHMIDDESTDDEIVIDLSWASEQDMYEYPKWLKAYDVDAYVKDSALHLKMADLYRLEAERKWQDRKSEKESELIHEEALKMAGEPGTKRWFKALAKAGRHVGEQEFIKLEIPEDTSKRNLQSRKLKRSIIIDWTYLYGDIVNDHIELMFPSKHARDLVVESLKNNDWVTVKPASFGLKLYPGKYPKYLPGIIKKMSTDTGRLSVKRFFNCIYAPNHMVFLVRMYEDTGKTTDTEVAIDLSKWHEQDVPEYVRWLNFLGVKARSEKDTLYCNIDDLLRYIEEEGLVLANKKSTNTGMPAFDRAKKEAAQDGVKLWMRYIPK